MAYFVFISGKELGYNDEIAYASHSKIKAEFQQEVFKGKGYKTVVKSYDDITGNVAFVLHSSSKHLDKNGEVDFETSGLVDIFESEAKAKAGMEGQVKSLKKMYDKDFLELVTDETKKEGDNIVRQMIWNNVSDENNGATIEQLLTVYKFDLNN